LACNKSKRNRMPRNQSLRFNVLVRYLPLRFNENDLYQLFSRAGHILSVKLMQNDGNSEGYGFVNFATRKDAECAINMFDGYRINARKVMRVSWSVPGSRLGCKVFVTNIPLHWSKRDFEIAFNTCDLAEEVRLLQIRHGRRSAFVLYANSEFAQNAMRTMNGVIPSGGVIPLRVELSKKNARQLNEISKANEETHSPQIPSTGKRLSNTIFFVNILTWFDDSFLKSLFGTYGQVIDISLQRDMNGKSLGMGFATFKEISSTRSCHRGLHNATLHGNNILIHLDV